MNRMTWEIFVSIFFYALLLFGIYIIFKKDIVFEIKTIRRRNSLRQRFLTKNSNNNIDNHLNNLLIASIGTNMNLKEYKIITIIIFVLSLTTAFSTIGYAAIFISAAIASLPYFILRIKLEIVRNKGSNEAEYLISEILNQYRINHFNIYESIEAVIREGGDEIKITKKLLFKLLVEIRHTKNEIYLKRAVSKFSYAINTNWSSMLGHCIYVAAKEGINITPSLEGIIGQLRIAKKLMEEKKRLNSESCRMVKFLVPAAYMGSIILAISYLEIPPVQLIKNQLFLKEGFLFFLLIIFLFVLNIVLLGAIQKGKFDF